MTATDTPTTLKRTPLYDRHVAAGARMVDFGGFEMPVKYAGEALEHMAVRQHCGIFDVSHMGEVFIEGEAALDAVQRLVTNDVTAIVDGQAMYAGLLNDRGTFVDDVVVYRFSATKLLLCVNAGNREKDFAWIDEVVRREFEGTATARDEGELWAQLAVQGPTAVDVVAILCGDSVRQLGNYHFAEGTVNLATLTTPAIIARTGYTGEDGFELYVPSSVAALTWDAILEVGKPFGLVPCGLAARDTLRLEAGMSLYGNDIDDAHTPLEAGLSWIVKLDKKPAFIGEPALRAQKAAGVDKLLRGLEMKDKGIPRHGYRVLSSSSAGEVIGEVTSGTQPPFLGRPIGMAYLARAHAEPGTEVDVEIRGRPVRATVVKLPFYKRAK